MSDVVKKILSNQIIDPVMPMRVGLDRDALWELADSIRQNGLINPITVRPIGEKYEVVAGHRRFKACQIAGVIEIPCCVRDLDDLQVFDIMAAENLARKDVDVVEEAIFVSRLHKEKGLSISEVAQKLNRSVTWVESRLSIVDYPEYMQIPLASGELSLGVAEQLACINDDVYRQQFVDSAVKNGMSILQAKYLKTQYDLGILIPSSSFIPKDDELRDTEPIKVKAPCARCGGIAIEPNLKNVFIHVDCPEDSTQTE